jgi:protocatechuate 3,4-dioxygenase beta subunit
MLAPNILGFNVNQGILFIVGGIAQVFWIIPMIRRWGKVWYGIGIAGTAVLMALFFITRVPGYPITGRGGGANPTSILVEVFEGLFIGLAVAILIYETRKNVREEQRAASDTARKSTKHVPILAGVVIALIVFGLFALPMAMPSPTGGPPPSGGQAGQQPGQQSPVGTSTNQTCTLTPSLIEIEGTPQQTEGPYFVDDMPNRSEILADTSTGTIQEGIPLNVTINVYDVDDGACIPLSNAQVDLWHANSQGVYSGVEGSPGTNFLRGYQLTDSNGTVQFSTIYPGWYEGRAIHIHVKVRTFEGSTETSEWTSQFYLPNSTNDQVHTQPPYSDHGLVGMANEQDGIYTGPSTDGLIQSNTGTHLMLALTEAGQGYAGTFNIIVDASP